MKILGLIEEDFINYKLVCMTIEMPYCDFKCGSQLCQNSKLAISPVLNVDPAEIIELYLNNNITEAIVFQGLEPFDSFNELINFIQLFRKKCDDDIVIYTGYNKDEILEEISQLKLYKNIIIKYGRFIPNQQKHFDEILKVFLVSDNQYAEKIS